MAVGVLPLKKEFHETSRADKHRPADPEGRGTPRHRAPQRRPESQWSGLRDRRLARAQGLVGLRRSHLPFPLGLCGTHGGVHGLAGARRDPGAPDQQPRPDPVEPGQALPAGTRRTRGRGRTHDLLREPRTVPRGAGEARRRERRGQTEHLPRITEHRVVRRHRPRGPGTVRTHPGGRQGGARAARNRCHPGQCRTRPAVLQRAPLTHHPEVRDPQTRGRLPRRQVHRGHPAGRPYRRRGGAREQGLEGDRRDRGGQGLG